MFRVAAVVAVVTLALWLRLARLDLVEFKNDEASALRLAEDAVQAGQVPLVGLTSSIAIHDPPYFIYFLTPVVALSRDPVFASGAIGVANVAGVAGLIGLGWRRFGPLVGLVAGLVYAANPWAVFYARKIWAQDLLAPMAVLFFVALDQAVVVRRASWAVAALPIFAIGVQVHFSFGLLAPLLIAPIGVLVARRRWRELALGLSLAALTALPYLLFNVQHDWTDFRAAQDVARMAATVDADGVGLVFGLASSWDYWYLPQQIHLDRVLAGRISAVAANLQTVLFLVGVAVALMGLTVRGASGRATRLRLTGMLVWMVLPAVLSVRHTVNLYEHYYLFVLPAAGLILGLAVRWLAHRPPPWGRPVLALAVSSVLVLGLIHTLMVTRLLDVLAVEAQPNYGPPLGARTALARDLARFGAMAGSPHLAIEVWGTDSEPMAYLARPYFPVLDLVTVGQVGLGPRFASALTPSAAARTPAATASTLTPPQRVGLRFDDGVAVQAAAETAFVTASERVGLAITWSVTPASPASAGGLTWEVALFDPRGAQINTATGDDHDLRTVQPGEMIVSWFTLDTEPGADPGQYTIRLRRLDRPSGQPVPFVDGFGQLSTELRLPPFELRQTH